MSAGSDFVHLHVHSRYSFRDGMVSPRSLVKKAKALGMPAVAMTDHGNLAGAIEFQQEADRVGIKPIFGCEVYVARCSRDEEGYAPFHLVLLAENERGWHNLIRLVSTLLCDGFYDTPKVDKDLLKECSEGLIALSACIDGEVASAFIDEGEPAAVRVIQEYKALFPEGRFFIEIQANGVPEQAELNRRLIMLARLTDTPLVATGDVHYLDVSDAASHAALLAFPRPGRLSFPGRASFPGNGFRFRSAEEMRDEFGEWAPDAISNTLGIAERCNVSLRPARWRIPAVPSATGMSAEKLLRTKVWSGFERRREEAGMTGDGSEEDGVYRERLEEELEAIGSKEVSGYFLVVEDYVGFAREKGIPVGPGRGSAPGSLVTWALGITDVDPIRHGLLYEPFLGEHHHALPCIMVDFCAERIGEVIEHIVQRYGRDRVARTLAFGRMRERSAERCVIAAQSDSSEEERKALARSLADAVASVQMHAAGLVISDVPMRGEIPLFSEPSIREPVTQYDWASVDRAGFVKFDLLSWEALTRIGKVERLVRERHDPAFRVEAIPEEDDATFRMIQRKQLEGVEGFSHPGMTNLLSRIKPEVFSHLVAAFALFRPGPVEAGIVEEYVDRRHGRKRVPRNLHASDDALSESYGLLLYKEQVLLIADRLADFSYREAERFKRALLRPDLALGAIGEAFVRGCWKAGCPPERVDRLVAQLRAEAPHIYPKSHAVASALLSWRMAWLKCHYPGEFSCLPI